VSAVGEGAGHANSANCIQLVGVVDHLCLESEWLWVSAETMGLYGVSNRLNEGWWLVTQQFACPLGPPQVVVRFPVSDVVQQSGSSDGFQICTLGSPNALSQRQSSAHVVKVVG